MDTFRKWLPFVVVQRINIEEDSSKTGLSNSVSINIDFVNEELGIDKRVEVELSPDSAVKLIKAIENAMAKGV